MKKGFTLVELLAVILLLGVIALISMPMINNVVKEAKYNIYKTNNDNIIKSVKKKCSSELSLGDRPTYEYTFKNGKSSSNLDMKGDLPEEGYVILDDECNIKNYYFENNNMLYSNTEDIREDYMLKAPATASQSIFKDLYSTEYSKFVEIYFVNHINIPENAIEIKDPSISENGKIKSWLVPNGENYNLYVGSEGTIYGNYNSSFMFDQLTLATHYDFSNFNTCFITNMYNLFNENLILTTLDISNWNTSNVTDMSRLFRLCYKLEKMDLGDWDISNVTNINSLFNSCYKLNNVGDIHNWDTSNITTMRHVFDGCPFKILDLSNWITNNVTDISCMFGSDDNKIMPLQSLYIDNFILTNIVTKDEVFNLANNLNYIRIKDASSANLLATIIPARTINSPGIIEILGDKSGLNINTFESKNWNII